MRSPVPTAEGTVAGDETQLQSVYCSMRLAGEQPYANALAHVHVAKSKTVHISLNLEFCPKRKT